jgi:hypothetical protein
MDCKFCNAWPGDSVICEKGHKPKFYKPKRWDKYGVHSDWGWKRRCGDFQEGTPKGQEVAYFDKGKGCEAEDGDA